MIELTRRQKELLENEGRQQIYTYIAQGIEPATLSEIASALDVNPVLVDYDLKQLREGGLIERVPDQRLCFAYRVAVEGGNE